MSPALKIESLDSELMYSKILYQIATAPISGGFSFAIEHSMKVCVSELPYHIGHWYSCENRTDQILASTKQWRLKDSKVPFKTFQEESEKILIDPNSGFYKDIKVTSPLCIENLSATNFNRLNLPSGEPFQSALFIPIVLKSQLFGFLEFFSTHHIVSTADLRRFAEMVSLELSRQLALIQNQEAEKQQVFQLAQASRLSSLGAMAGGIAHEINNPLTIIMGTIKMAIREIESPNETIDRKKIVQSLDKARAHTERITKIVKGIRAMSRDGAHDPFIFSKVKDILEDTLNLCEARVKTNNIQLSYEMEEDGMVLQCRPVQISQVILNLINNSMDAVGDLPNPWINLSAVNIGSKSIEFRLTDAGLGIPEDVANQLMQPFFTTKGTGRGTGLGLSISQEIIKAHSGKFYLNRECKNTQFIVSLPIEQESER